MLSSGSLYSRTTDTLFSTMLFLLFLFFLVLSASASASSHTGSVRRHARAASPATVARAEYSGHGTWYNPGQGACGSHATSHDYIVALNGPQYHHDSMCYKGIRITNTMNGKSVGAKIQDECPDCPYGSLDLSPVVFTAIADSGLGEGEISISWSFTGSSRRAPDPHAPASFLSTGSLTLEKNIALTPAFGSNAGSRSPDGGLNPTEAQIQTGASSHRANRHKHL